MKRALAILALIGVVVGAAVYNYRARNTAPSPIRASSETGLETAIPVTVTTARHTDVRRTVTLIGVLKTDRQAAVSTKIPTRIAAVLVREGQWVRAGQPVVRLDVADAKAQVSGAEAAVRAADAQVKKAIDGKAARAVEMDAQIAQALGGLKTARAKLRQAEAGVRLTSSAAGSDVEKAAAAVKQAQAGLDQAEYGLRQAEDNLKRTLFLYSHGGVPKAEMEGARTQADIARSQREAAAAALQQAKAALGPARETVPLRTEASEADVLAARAGAQQAEDGLRNARRARVEALRIADRDIDAARAQAAQARAGLAQAQAQVGSGVLTSPLDGVVTNLAIHAGEVAQPGAPLMTIVGGAPVYMEAPAATGDAAVLRPGQPACVTVDTLPGRTLGGRVMEVLPTAAADSRSLPVRIRILSSGIRLTPGVTAKAVIDVPAARNALSVPTDAVRTDSRGTFVYVVQNGKAVRRDVTVGETTENGVQIVSGLRDGERVIVAGPAALQPGTPVQVVGS